MSVFICVFCGSEVDIDLDRNHIQCTKCGSRVVMKPKPPALKKRVKAV